MITIQIPIGSALRRRLLDSSHFGLAIRYFPPTFRPVRILNPPPARILPHQRRPPLECCYDGTRLRSVRQGFGPFHARVPAFSASITPVGCVIRLSRTTTPSRPSGLSMAVSNGVGLTLANDTGPACAFASAHNPLSDT